MTAKTCMKLFLFPFLNCFLEAIFAILFAKMQYKYADFANFIATKKSVNSSQQRGARCPNQINFEIRV